MSQLRLLVLAWRPPPAARTFAEISAVRIPLDLAVHAMRDPDGMHLDHWKVMKEESSSEPGSFMLTLRTERRWDKPLFARMEAAMRTVCKEVEEAQTLDRWLAEGFWFITDSVPADTAHPAFPRPDSDYYDRATKRLWELAHWFFHGCSPYVPEHEWEPF